MNLENQGKVEIEKMDFEHQFHLLFEKKKKTNK